MMNKKLQLCITILVLILLNFSSFIVAEEDNSDIDLGWYDVEEWEVNICTTDFGPQSIVPEEAESPENYLLNFFGNDFIITMSVQRGDAVPIDEENFGYIYEVSWYVEPIVGSVNYDLILTDIQGNKEVIVSTSSTISNRVSGYQAIIRANDQAFKNAVLSVPDADIILTIPFMDKNGLDKESEDNPFSWSGIYEDEDE